jgi:hypothetical protein
VSVGKSETGATRPLLQAFLHCSAIFGQLLLSPTLKLKPNQNQEPQAGFKCQDEINSP